MSEWRKISRCTPGPKHPAGKDAASAGGGTRVADPEACPVHSAASALFLSVYLASLLSRLWLLNYSSFGSIKTQLTGAAAEANPFCCGGGGGGGGGRPFQLAFYYVLGINEILLFFGWKSGLSDYHANSKI